MRLAMNRRRFCLWGAAVLLASVPLPTGRATENDPLVVKIDRNPVQSTHLTSVGYHAASRVLEIEFRNGDIYRYLDVPPLVVEGLSRAESKGRYFSSAIRRRFQFRRITKGTP